ncbi:MAG: class I SAM-dependent methyltransferase [Desulfurococcaceae archaeon]
MQKIYVSLIKSIMKIALTITIKLKLYNIFWSSIALIAPRKGAAWLSKANYEEWGRKDAEYILHVAEKYGVTLDTFMDYGCGYGRVAKFIAPYVKKLICADVSSIYLARAKRYLRSNLNIEYVKVNGKDLKQIKNHQVDLVYSIGVFVHINKKDAYILSREIARILKPEGVFVVDLPKPGCKWPSFEEYSQEDILMFLEPYRELEKEVGNTVIRYVLRVKSCRSGSEA